MSSGIFQHLGRKRDNSEKAFQRNFRKTRRGWDSVAKWKKCCKEGEDGHPWPAISQETQGLRADHEIQQERGNLDKSSFGKRMRQN